MPRASRPAPDARGYWRANLRVMAVLLSVWFLASYLPGILLVEQLNRIRVGGFPLGFWFAHQGSIVVFVILILIYALWMDRLDRRYGVD
jgi:putative solute:sodium symporter small subunit